MENKQTPSHTYFTGLMRFLSEALESIFVSDSTKDFRRLKQFIAS